MKRLLYHLAVVLLLGGMATVLGACARSTGENSAQASVSQEQEGGRLENVPDQLQGKRVLVVMKLGGWENIPGELADATVKSAVEAATGQTAVLNRDTERYYETRIERMEKRKLFVPYGMAVGYLYATNEGDLLRIGPSGKLIGTCAEWERRYFKTGNPN
jgi:hypothetical protein